MVRALPPSAAKTKGWVPERSPILSCVGTNEVEPSRDSATDWGGATQLSKSWHLADSANPVWRFLCLAEIGNFAALRRQLGIEGANRLLADAEAHIVAVLPRARVRAIGRTALEISFEGGALADLEAALDELRATFARVREFEGEPVGFEMLLAGAADPVGHTEDVRLAEEAEGALEQARLEKRIVIRDLSAGTPAFDRLTLARDLPPAIANCEMFLQYQPKVNVRRQEVASAEALVRWQHPTRGLISPGDFITLAEEIGEIGPLTLWTLDQVIEDQKRLSADGHDMMIFINISGQLLADTEFVDAACRKVREGSTRIGFEITETSVIRDPDVAIAHLQILAAVGVTIAIDDYGAGLSSLAYLKQLPARELKIDKLFVLNLTSSQRDPLIVRSTIDLAHALDMEVTAEGVETQAAMALLTVMGCDMVQGYLISRPISIEAFREYLRHDQWELPDNHPESMFSRPPSFWKRA
ncbi:EAL domain-containing protein [Sphingomonas endolithica]|uniref:EAL domain-containing protein n=1 Tax=Sphingomonas endolithica TaxID=2972485 RepID=UPI0021AF010D|nr:EAL domain-containing protein [Sphingomonas sp. ZFBP2030]